MADLTWVLGELQRLARENERLWTALDECMRDQTASDKKIEKLEKRVERLEKKKQPTVDEEEKETVS